MPQEMATEIERHCETIEACYEFTLSYAARGLAGDDGSDVGRQLREHLTRAAEAMRGLERSCAETMEQEQLAPAEKYEAFFAVAIGSQTIDNLNASIHLRALLADLFLVTEILGVRRTRAKAQAANGVGGGR